MAEELCTCGRPLHYTNPRVEADVRMLIARHGETVPITLVDGTTYQVPRHFMALHGIQAWTLPDIAAQYGFSHD